MTAAGRRTAGSPARILLLGKRGSLVVWLENLYRACARLGHPTQVFAINGNTPLLGLWAMAGAYFGGSGMDAGLLRAGTGPVPPGVGAGGGVFRVPPDYYRLLYAQARRP